MKRSLTISSVLVIIIAGICFYAGCDKPSPTDPASEARIHLSAGALRIPADGVSTTTVLAYVRKPDGTNADAVPIDWETSCGVISEAESSVAGGVASATIVSDTYPCNATITANLPTLRLRDSITIEFYNEDSAYISISAFPDRIPADAESTTIITAFVQDSYGHPVPEETSVYFSTDAGTLDSSSAGTEQGRAVVTLTSSSVEDTAHVTAVCGNQSASCSVRFYSTLVGSIELRASLYDLPADGSSKSVITATVKDVNNRYVKDNTKVYFTTTAGSLSASETTTSQGIATIFLTSATSETTAAVAATSGNVTRVIYVRFYGAGSSLEINPEYATVPINGSKVFTVTGGTSPYSWYLEADSSFGTLSTSSGASTVFTAKTKTGSSHLYVIDSKGAQASALIIVTDPSQ